MPRILIADDHANIRQLLRTFVETQTGFDVCGEAGTGTEAIEKAQELKPDIVVLDLAMPELNGIEAASVIKRSLPDIRIVLFTLRVDGLGRKLATWLGIEFVLSKEESISKFADYLKSLPGASMQATTAGPTPDKRDQIQQESEADKSRSEHTILT